MGPLLPNTLINPNQLQQYGVTVQDNPVSHKSLYIMTEDNTFSMELKMKGTIIIANTLTTSTEELYECPHIILSSPHQWDPQNVTFHSNSIPFEDEINKIDQYWKQCGFEFADYKKGNEKRGILIKVYDDIKQSMDDHLTNLQNIEGSRYAGA